MTAPTRIRRRVVRLTTLAIVCTFPTWTTHSNTEAPPGLGRAGTWVVPCQLLDRQTRGETLKSEEAQFAALCQGAFSGIMAVNFIDPPYLPFCERDNDRLIDYVRIFLAFMRGHPDYATKNFGLAVVLSLSQAHPKEECTR